MSGKLFIHVKPSFSNPDASHRNKNKVRILCPANLSTVARYFSAAPGELVIKSGPVALDMPV